MNCRLTWFCNQFLGSSLSRKSRVAMAVDVETRELWRPGARSLVIYLGASFRASVGKTLGTSAWAKKKKLVAA